ncbi:hypothetical protein PMAYCL1PPCAC_08399 [Pristionchus mayeri]|uniref:RING-type domain-containing protein n=1 Tax=Pristionchus mayeri TaxID=1317129 RepID=A0AAN4ZER1_9BILA|nr:hypothetical protein PMAYCL1PPCAC_08399 [Pristionchus mayeri]
MQSPDDSVEDCSICMSDLNAKLSVLLRPCGHKFHYSCARKWMETRSTRRDQSRDDQSCPLCRTVTTEMVDESGNTYPPGYPFGVTGEPTREVLRREEQPAMLHQLIQETVMRLSKCEVLLKAETKGNEYVEDMQSQKRELEIRLGSLQQMLREFEAGERTVEVRRGQARDHEERIRLQDQNQADQMEDFLDLMRRLRRNTRFGQGFVIRRIENERRNELVWVEDREEFEYRGELGRQQRERQQ